MGCDIHSRAEIRIDGQWQILGDVFPETSRMRWFVPDREYLEGTSDAVLMDAIDYYIARRIDGKNDGDSKLPEIPVGSDLEWKLLEFHRIAQTAYEWGREKGRAEISRDDDGSYDPDGWTRFQRETIRKAAEINPLTAEERAALIDAILNYRTYTRDEWVEDRHRGDYDTDEENRLTLTETKTEEDDIEWFHNEPLDSRNYSLFAVLADVRNYDDGVTPIHPPKGQGTWTKKPVGDGEDYEWVLSGDARLAPEDACEEIQKFQRDHMGVDGHSHSWLTLREFIEYDFDDDIDYEGLVTITQYDKMKEEGWPENPYSGPDTWARGIGDGGAGPNGKTVSFTADAYEKWVRVGRPILTHLHEGGSLGLISGVQVTEDLVPDENYEGVEVVDLWTEVYGWSEEEIAQAEKRRDGLIESRDRYVYNGIKPWVYASWKEKRSNVMGEEFRNMIRIFQELVEEHGITEDDIRVVFHFDN